MAHKPERSQAQKHSASEDVLKRFGGFTSEAKAGRTHRVSERRPFRTEGPTTRK